MTDAAPTACILIIGDEILSGRIQDANVQFFAQQFGAMGIRLRECRIIPDVPAAIVEALNTVRALYTYVFTTGGIGPTHDDITTDCVAAAFGRKVVPHPKIVDAMERHWGRDKLTAARLRMANVPDGPDVALIESQFSIAPGYRIGNVFVMAGVPVVARGMFAAVAPTLRRGAPVLSQSVDAPVREDDIAAPLEALQQQYPQVSLGSYPYYRDNKVGAAIVARSTDKAALAAVIVAVAQMMRDVGAEPVIGPAP